MTHSPEEIVARAISELEKARDQAVEAVRLQYEAAIAPLKSGLGETAAPRRIVHTTRGLRNEDRVLHVIAREGGATTSSRIMRILSMNSGTLSGVITRLGRKGLVQEDRAWTGKARKYELTEKGRVETDTTPQAQSTPEAETPTRSAEAKPKAKKRRRKRAKPKHRRVGAAGNKYSSPVLDRKKALVIDYLRQNPGEHRQADLARALGEEPRNESFRRAIKALTQAGDVLARRPAKTVTYLQARAPRPSEVRFFPGQQEPVDLAGGGSGPQPGTIPHKGFPDARD